MEGKFDYDQLNNINPSWCLENLVLPKREDGSISVAPPIQEEVDRIPKVSPVMSSLYGERGGFE